MLTIDRMRLHLPPLLESHTPEIVRLLAEELAVVPLAADLNIDRLTVGPVLIPLGSGHREVARAVASAIGTTLRKGQADAQHH
jgi:hypothetical protein